MHSYRALKMIIWQTVWWPTFLINFTLLFTKLPIKKDSPVKYIIYVFPDICSKSKELAIYSVEDCLEEISFSWILTIKEVKKLKNKEKQTVKHDRQFTGINQLKTHSEGNVGVFLDMVYKYSWKAPSSGFF